MKKWLMATVFGTVLVLGACGNDGDDASEPADDVTEPDTEEEADSGDDAAVSNDAAEELYQQSCASCHGDDLSGAVGPSLETVGADMSADDIEEIIDEGVGSMPGGLLAGDDAKEVADWLAEHK